MGYALLLYLFVGKNISSNSITFLQLCVPASYSQVCSKVTSNRLSLSISSSFLFSLS